MFNLEPTTTDWITAISSVIYTIVTIVIAVIAWQAKNTWKNEIKAKKKLELAEKLYGFIIDIDNIFNSNDLGDLTRDTVQVINSGNKQSNLLRDSFTSNQVEILNESKKNMKSAYRALQNIMIQYKSFNIDLEKEIPDIFTSNQGLFGLVKDDETLFNIIALIKISHKIEHIKFSESYNEKLSTAKEFCKKQFDEFYNK
ncbi:MAG TPA: hypothetical protein P5556_02240 [Candidatus Gastranaerophilales bacterium]|nr:hypothetical protein [Candidatus Gastranaerophilales bacterium]